ncbi:MAG: oligosaccharide flippase family protein [Gammaproteobacteria bacterium]|nr:oligosaccharide flippase family protein [Gammaproteobacteria bacterium]
MIRSLIDWVHRNDLGRRIFSVASGTAVGQGVTVLVSPLLARLYTPEAMGLWGLFVSFVGVATVGGALRYEAAIVAAKRDEEALLLTGYALGLAFVVSLVAGGLFEVFRRYRILGYDAFPVWGGFAAAFAVLLNVWGQIFRFWFIREKLFHIIGYFVASRGVFRAFVQLIAYPWRGLGLIGGEIVGRLLSLAFFVREFPIRAFGYLSFQRSWHLLWKYKEYPMVFLPSAFVDTMALMAPVPVFTSLYGIEVGGMLALAQRTVSIPLVLLGTAVADVFFGEIAEAARSDKRRARELFLQATLRLGLLALALGFGLWLLAPRAIRLIFGAQWVLAGQMLSVMAPWFVGILTVNPLSRLVFLSRYPWSKLIYDVGALGGIIFLFWVHIPDPLTALRLVAWIQALLYGLYWVILLSAVLQGLEVK